MRDCLTRYAYQQKEPKKQGVSYLRFFVFVDGIEWVMDTSWKSISADYRNCLNDPLLQTRDIQIYGETV